ncbi:MAG: hypothetical protein ACEPO8_07640 [Rhodothermaceae bacterium]
MRETFLEIIKELFEINNICESTKLEDLENWNSLNQINLMIILEEAFSIKIEVDEMQILKKNIKEIISFIDSKKCY